MKPDGLNSLFLRSYRDARQRFLSLTQERGLSVTTHDLGVPGRDGEALAMDVTWDGPVDASHVLLPDFNFDIWIGVQVPKNTPEAVVNRINQAMNETLKSPEVRKAQEATGSQIPKPMSVAELDKLYVSEVDRYKAIFKSINLSPQ